MVAGLALGALAGVVLERGAAADGQPDGPSVSQRIIVVVPEHDMPTTTTATVVPTTGPTTSSPAAPETTTGTVAGGSVSGGATDEEAADVRPDDHDQAVGGALPRTGPGPLAPMLVVVGLVLVATGRAVLALARLVRRRALS